MRHIIGNCAICNELKELTFEHVPPRAAFNNKPIFIQLSDHLIEHTSPVFGKKMRSPRGFGEFTLCQSCNNNTGTWYAKDFVAFAKQGMEILKRKENPGYVRGEYVIKPLNVFKQILSMFMSADKAGVLRSNDQLKKFILDKHSNDFPVNFKIFLYSNASAMKRKLGYHVVHHEKFGIQKWYEINFKPFGYFLTEDSEPAHENMVDITNFHKLAYDDKYKITITTPYLHVKLPLIGIYN